MYITNAFKSLDLHFYIMLISLFLSNTNYDFLSALIKFTHTYYSHVIQSQSQLQTIIATRGCTYTDSRNDNDTFKQHHWWLLPTY